MGALPVAPQSATPSGSLSADALRALRLVADVERRLPPGSLPSTPESGEDVVVGKRGSPEVTRVPRAVIDQRRWWPRRSHPAVVERLILGSTGPLFRVRAFYPAAARTLVVHADVPLFDEARLHRGARIQASLAGATPFRIPAVHQVGRSRRVAWMLEEMLPGGPFPTDEFVLAAPSLAAGLATMWPRSLGRRPIANAIDDAVVAGVESCVLELDVDGAYAHRVLAWGDTVRRENLDLLLGLGHGDTVRSNWLYTGTAPPGLVDWESAGRRPVGNDLMKILIALPDPRSVLQAVPVDAFTGSRLAPAEIQVAVPVFVWLGRWPGARVHAEQTGRLDATRARWRRALELLERLVD